MQNKLKSAYKETPERFRYAIDSAICEAENSAPERNRHPKKIVISIAVLVILVLIPATIFGATKIIGGMDAQKEGDYGVKINTMTDPDATYPEYVKMHVTVPDGFGEVPNTDGLKYYNLSTEKPYTDGFSLLPMRPTDSNSADLAYFAEGYSETVIAGHTAYKIIPIENYNGFDRVYVYYEDVNVILLIFYKDVTEQQLTDLVAGIIFTEGTAEDHTVLTIPEIPEEGKQTVYVPDNTFIEKPLDTEFTFGEYDEETGEIGNPSVGMKVSGVRVLDSINKLDADDFNDLYMYEDITDENGALLPHTREVYRYGDGIDTKDELLSSEEIDRRAVLVDLEYTNLTDEDKTIYIPWRISAMIKCHDGSLKPSGAVNEEENIRYGTELASNEIWYMSEHGDGKAFYSTTLLAGETKTITIGFLADADKLDELYLSCCPSADDVYSPSFPTENPYTYFLMKVL